MPLYLGNQKVGQLYLGDIPLFGSGGASREKLLEALKYSPLNLPEDASAEDIYKALSNYWPEKIVLFDSSSPNKNPYNYTPIPPQDVSIASDGSLLLLQKSGDLPTYGWFDQIDFTNIKTMKIRYRYRTIDGVTQDGNRIVFIAQPKRVNNLVTGTVWIENGYNLNSTGAWVEEEFDLSTKRLSGKLYLGIACFSNNYDIVFQISKLELISKPSE